MFSLAGKTILVTGASSGIGRQIAVSASQMGATLVLTGRNAERLEETKQLLSGPAQVIAADLIVEADLTTLIGQLPDLNGVVFCAGLVEYVPLKFLNYEKIKTVMALNFDSQVILTQKLVKNKKIQKNSSLVYISSISSKIGVPATALYASSKAAIVAFAKVVASELAAQKIRANCVCPGIVRTPMIENAKDTVTQESFTEAEKSYPLGLGEPVDVAGPVVFLLSDASKWVTGTEMIVDGGLTLQ